MNVSCLGFSLALLAWLHVSGGGKLLSKFMPISLLRRVYRLWEVPGIGTKDMLQFPISFYKCVSRFCCVSNKSGAVLFLPWSHKMLLLMCPLLQPAEGRRADSSQEFRDKCCEFLCLMYVCTSRSCACNNCGSQEGWTGGEYFPYCDLRRYQD